MSEPDPSPSPSQFYECEKCHEQVTIGQWPYCPHGTGLGELGEFHEYFDPHITSERDPSTGRVGRWITSRRDREKLMKQNNLEYSVRLLGMLGCEW